MIMAFDSEYEAFRAYADVFREASVFLIDTYGYESGINNAVRAAKQLGIKFRGVRDDSGDLAEHSKIMRKILDENGFADTKIVVSNDLDEKIIESLMEQGAKIDLYGIGTKLATADGSPSLGIVYKLAEIDGRPAIKISGNREKITDPGKKQIYRVEKDGYFAGDIMALAGEDLHGKVRTSPRMDDVEVKTLDADNAVQLLVPVFTNGELVYETPELRQIQKNALRNLQQCLPQMLRTENPAQYWVGLSPELAKVKRDLIKKYQIQK
jgi:nicotinate phosphoribosyltransferase